MTTKPAATLEDVRREIDAIDDGLVDLLARRFQMVEHVKTLKRADAAAPSLPLRPAREASVLRRVVARGRAHGLNPELLVRLWPAIICEASLRQSPVTIHVSKPLAGDIGHRLALNAYFPSMPVTAVDDEAAGLAHVATGVTDICVVAADSGWLTPYLAGTQGRARVIAALPVESGLPLLVIGHATSEVTKRDETLIVTKGNFPREFPVKPRWQVDHGVYHLSALPGFLSEKEAPLMGLIRANGALGLKVLGRYPSPVTATE